MGMDRYEREKIGAGILGLVEKLGTSEVDRVRAQDDAETKKSAAERMLRDLYRFVSELQDEAPDQMSHEAVDAIRAKILDVAPWWVDEDKIKG